jgi:tyrosinase
MSGNIAITGIPTTPGPDGELIHRAYLLTSVPLLQSHPANNGPSIGAVPLRRELRDLQRNFPDQYNLLILGLKNLEGQDASNSTSYYQIAGIHGMPYKPWNGVGSTTNWQSTSGFGGYCTHSSILFLTWHRPYLALYEVGAP